MASMALARPGTTTVDTPAVAPPLEVVDLGSVKSMLTPVAGVDDLVF
jgi:hypothetical protein